MAMDGEFSRYLEDVYSAGPVPREALTDECEILVVGAGFAGLLLWYKLRQAGFTDVRFCEKGGDVGGTWYWNRYPGIACDVESYSYLPLLEEMEYFPTMKFASGFEIFEYCQRMAEKFEFYDHCLFHTTVERTEWDEAAGRWTVYTDRGDAMRCPFRDPRQRHSHHAEAGPYRGHGDLRGRFVPHLRAGTTTSTCRASGSASSARVRPPSRRSPSWRRSSRSSTSSSARPRRSTSATSGRRARRRSRPGRPNRTGRRQRRARFARISALRTAVQANDDYLAGKVADFRPPGPKGPRLSPEEWTQKQLDDNFAVMEQIRARVDAIIEDPKTAAALKPYYPYGCKRPTFHDEYLPTFNLPHVTLVDTAPQGVSRINEQGVVHEGVEYPLDVLIYATGFQWMATSTFNMIVGRGGRTLTEKWTSEGTKTFLGLHSHGFPNLFIVTGPQGGGGSFNFTDAIDAHADYIAWMLTALRDRGIDVVDVRPEPEEEYAAHCREADLATAPLRDCLSYYNGHGEAEPGSLAYYGGRRWHTFREHAQETLEPFIFGSVSEPVS